MTLKYSVYVKVQNRICLSYQGHCPEYGYLLGIVRPALQRYYSDLDIYISVRDEFIDILSEYDQIIPRSKLKETRDEFAYVKEIELSFRGPHPIETLFEESGLKVPTISPVENSEPGLCCIFSKGMLPTNSLTQSEIEHCVSLATYEGYTVDVDPSRLNIDQTKWVMGVECLPFYQLSARGIRSTLIPTGIGVGLYKKMFPNGEVRKL